MMKKLCLILAILLLPSMVDAKGYCCRGKFLPEFKVSYYRFSDSTLRKIYDDGGVLYEGELNYNLCSNVLLFVGGGYLRKHGESLCAHEGTRIRLIPVSFGAKYYWPVMCQLDLYLGGGLRYFFLDIKNSSDFVRRHVNDSCLGGVINGGAYYKWGCIMFNPFIEYSIRQFKFSRSKKDHEWNIDRHNICVNGWSFGAGIGYLF